MATVQACPGLKKLLFQMFAHEGFVKACPVGWIPTTRVHLYYKCMLVFARGRGGGGITM